MLQLYNTFLLKKIDAALEGFFFVHIESEAASLCEMSEMLLCTNMFLSSL